METTGDPVNGCEMLAALCDQIVLVEPGIEPGRFLEVLGQTAAGIETGFRGIFDLARGGSNPIPGGGFKPAFDDDTEGQGRHFAGIAASASRFGSGPTTFVSHTFLDKPETPDGRLSTVAAEFAVLLKSGELQPADAGAWVRDRLCAG